MKRWTSVFQGLNLLSDLLPSPAPLLILLPEYSHFSLCGHPRTTGAAPCQMHFVGPLAFVCEPVFTLTTPDALHNDDVIDFQHLYCSLHLAGRNVQLVGHECNRGETGLIAGNVPTKHVVNSSGIDAALLRPAIQIGVIHLIELLSQVADLKFLLNAFSPLYLNDVHNLPGGSD